MICLSFLVRGWGHFNMEGAWTQLHFVEALVILLGHTYCLRGGADFSPWWEIADTLVLSL